MAEQRLIDADVLNKEAEESICENPHTGIMAKAMHTHEHKHFLCMIAHQPTIDPETLPIVKQLREQVKSLQMELSNWDFWYGPIRKHEAEVVRENQAAVKVMRKRCEKTIAELREELKRVKAERDAAMSFIPKTCATCKYGKSPCDWCVYDPDGDLNWEWNGKAKEKKNG